MLPSSTRDIDDATAPATSLRSLVDFALSGIAPEASGSTSLGSRSLAAHLSAVRAASGRVDPAPDNVPEQPWLRVAERLGLSDYEVVAGWLALRVEVDPLFSTRIRALQGDGRTAGESRPTLGLLARVISFLDASAGLPPSRIMAMLACGAGAASGVFRALTEDATWSERTLRLHPALLPPLLGSVPNEADRVIFDGFEIELLIPPVWQLPQAWLRALEPIEAALQSADSSVLVMRSHDLAETRGVAAMLAQQTNWRVAAIHLRDSELGRAVSRGLEPWLLATDAVPLFEVPSGPDARLLLPALRFYRGPVLVAAGQEGAVEISTGLVREAQLRIAAPRERAYSWKQALPQVPDPVCERLAHWRCGVGALHAVAAQAQQFASMRGVPVVDEADLQVARDMHVRTQLRRLGTLAQSIDSAVDDDALVVSESEQTDLDLLAIRCVQRETLIEGLGPVLRARAQPGVKALLVGASGTGKTLAAQWLAHRLGKPLLRVDAAAVTSKYIGETEKNLGQLLSSAEHLDCVLLFDEADALFGSRTDVKHANDRFANAQTNYLLTRIESFGGIAILTSNSKARFDDAFIRRLDAIVQFGLPRALERRALWATHLGEAHSLTAEQISYLAAQIELPGGNIRNVVLCAALIARSRSELRLDLADIHRALAMEYDKLGRPAPDGFVSTR